MIAVRLYTTLEIVGVVVQWVSALLLLVLFRQLARLGAQQRLLTTWSRAWAALLLGLSGYLLGPVAADLHLGLPAWLTWAAAHLYAPAKLAFLALVLLGAVQVAGIRISWAVERRAGLAAVAIGLLLSLLVGPDLIISIQVVITPLLFAGCAILVFRRGPARRRSASIFLAIALSCYALLWAIYFLAVFDNPASGPAHDWIDAIARSSGYGDALVAALLGAAVIASVIQASFIDLVAERERRLTDLATSEARLLGIIEAAEEAIITLDGKGRVELCNAAAERMFGTTMEHLLGHSLERLLLVPEMLKPQVLVESAPVRSGNEQSGTVTFLGEGSRIDGTRFPLEFSVGALRSDRDTGSVVILRDLTQRRQVQLERERFERRVAESEKMLAIGRLVSGIAHELNNPLAVVLGQSEQLLGEAEEGDARSSLRLIHEQAHRARHIVKDLLAFVRQREKQRDPVDLAGLVERVMAAQGAALADAGVALTAAVAPGLPPVLADRLAIEQVLVNLVENARDAAGRGGTARIECDLRDGDVVVVVEDSGSGVPADVERRVFEPFFTTKPVGSGTGLGLSVSLGIVEQHGGTLRLVNRPRPGVGARFEMTLPPTQWSATPPLAAARPASGLIPEPAAAEGVDSTVLLVDDEPSVRSTLSRLLQKAGWTVREAASGEEALAFLLPAPQAGLPTLILCDLRMPGIGGREVHAKLAEERPVLLDRLIFVTGDVVAPETATFLTATGCEVVEKPFTVAELGTVMERVLARNAGVS